MSDRIELVKQFYEAFSKSDRTFVEKLLSQDFTFSSPLDPILDRNGFFEICWSGGAGKLHDFNFVRLIEHNDEIVVTYEFVKPDNTKSRNTEVITFDGDKIVRAEVYFGVNLHESH